MRISGLLVRYLPSSALKYQALLRNGKIIRHDKDIVGLPRCPNRATGSQKSVPTGASGFIGTRLVKQLLLNGYNVRAAAQKPGSAGYQPDYSESQHLEKIAGGLPGNLETFEADLDLPETLDKPLNGATYA